MRIRSRAWLALILPFLAAARPETAAQPPTAPDVAAVADAPAARRERPADRRDAVRQALRKRVSKTFEKVPVADALDWLREELNLNLFVDTVQIDAHGLSERLAGEVTLAVHDVTGRSLLELLLNGRELNWDVCDHVLVICPNEGLRRHLWVYDVHELVLFQDYWTTGGAIEDWADYTELLDVITSIIEPDSWEFSGPASVRQLTIAGRAVLGMRNTWHIGDQLQSFLEELHAVVPTGPRESDRAVTFVVSDADKLLANHEVRSLERAEESKRLQAALSQRISPRLETTLREAVQWVARELHCDCVLDLKKLDDEQLAKHLDAPVTLNLTEVRAETVLTLLLHSRNLDFLVRQGVLVITTADQAGGELENRIYDLNRLFEKSSFPADLSELIDFVTTMVDPDSWDATGGPACIRPFQGGGDRRALVVRQTARNQDALRQLLDDVLAMPHASSSQVVRPIRKAAAHPESTGLPGDEEPSTRTAEPMIDGINRWGFELYHRLASKRAGNFVMSPAGAALGLSPILQGAQSGSRDKIQREIAPEWEGSHTVAELSAWRERLVMPSRNRSIAPVPRIESREQSSGEHAVRNRENLVRVLPPCRLQLPTHGWIDARNDLDGSIREAVRDRFQTEIETVDFRRPVSARATINGWINRRTNWFSRERQPAGFRQTERDANLMLTSYVTLSAGWDQPFESRSTSHGEFQTPEGVRTVSFMKQHERTRYGKFAEFEIIERPLGRGRWSMIFLLPRDRDTELSRLEQQCTPEFVNEHLAKLSRRDVDVILPWFSVETTSELLAEPRTVELDRPQKDAEGNSTDSPEAQCDVFSILQVTRLEVTEAGLNLPATSNGNLVNSLTTNSDPVEFRADHPFLFLLREHDCGTFVMIGRFVGPMW